jgi:molybdate transport system permease protein
VITPAELSAVRLSLEVAALAVGASILPAVAVAWVLARCRFPGKLALDVMVHLPLVMPPVAVGYLLLAGLGNASPVGGWLRDVLGIELAFTIRGAALAAGVMGFPLMVRAIRSAMEAVDPRLEQAASTLGASPWRVFRTITLPLCMPGIIAGAVLCFARSLGEFGATVTFAGSIEGRTRTIPAAIYTWSQTPGGDAPAMRLLALSVLISIVALVASGLLARRVVGQVDGRGRDAA